MSYPMFDISFSSSEKIIYNGHFMSLHHKFVH